METSSGISRRDVLKRGAIAGSAVLWAVPAIQVIGLGASHAEAASGGGSTTPPPGGGKTTSPPTVTNSTPPPGPQVLPQSYTTPEPAPTVKGISFEQPPPKANPPVATLPFTGAAVPVTGAVVLGAGLVATGAAAVVATRRRQEVATASGDPASIDPELPAL
jgi:hypothetical protein